MTEPRTAAGRALLAECEDMDWPTLPDAILDIEAEARAAERARIRAAVEGLDSLAGWVTWDVDLHPNDERYINRAVVLALLDPQP